jgi:WD40 repeat protein
MLSGDRLLTWRDTEFLVWNADGRQIGGRTRGPTAVTGAIELRDGRILSFARGGVLQLWSSDGEPIGEPIGTPIETDQGEFIGVVECTNGRILLWGWIGGQLRDLDGQLLNSISYPRPKMSGLLPEKIISAVTSQRHGFLLCEKYRFLDLGAIVVFDGNLHETDRHEVTAIVDGAVELSDGRILYWTEDHFLHIWDAERERQGQQQQKGLSWQSIRHDLVVEGNRTWRALSESLSRLERRTNDAVATVSKRDLGSFASAIRTGALSRVSERIHSSVRSSRVGANDLLREIDGMTAHTAGLVSRRLLKRARTVLSAWGQSGDHRKVTVPEVFLGDKDVIGSCELSTRRFLSWGGTGLQLWSRYGEALGPVLDEEGRGAIEVAGDRFLSWNSDGVFRLWTLTGRVIGEPVPAHSAWVNRVIKLADGRLLSMSRDQTLRMWGRDGALVGQPMSGHRGAVTGATELADGRLLSWSDDRRYGAAHLDLRRSAPQSAPLLVCETTSFAGSWTDYKAASGR